MWIEYKVNEQCKKRYIEVVWSHRGNQWLNHKTNTWMKNERQEEGDDWESCG